MVKYEIHNIISNPYYNYSATDKSTLSSSKGRHMWTNPWEQSDPHVCMRGYLHV